MSGGQAVSLRGPAQEANVQSAVHELLHASVASVLPHPGAPHYLKSKNPLNRQATCRAIQTLLGPGFLSRAQRSSLHTQHPTAGARGVPRQEQGSGGCGSISQTQAGADHPCTVAPGPWHTLYGSIALHVQNLNSELKYLRIPGCQLHPSARGQRWHWWQAQGARPGRQPAEKGTASQCKLFPPRT